MDSKSKILLAFLVTLVTLSVSASYYRFMVLHDYVVEAQTDCDPTLESCFVWTCDAEVDGECTGNTDEDTWYYKFIYRNAKNIPQCDPEDDTCIPLMCPDGEEECDIVTCSDAAREEYEILGACTVPENFAEEISIENDPEETILEENGDANDESTDVVAEESPLENGSEIVTDEETHTDENSEILLN